jgi:hypothetical protein
MLDTGVPSTIKDLARAKGVAPSYMSRVLRLTLLAPEIMEAIRDGRQQSAAARLLDPSSAAISADVRRSEDHPGSARHPSLP